MREAEEKAREFMAEIREINERQGMNAAVPDEVYESSVREVARATESLSLPLDG
jgi:hypothetical protein